VHTRHTFSDQLVNEFRREVIIKGEVPEIVNIPAGKAVEYTVEQPIP
jgi:hypothetical protein